jgi:hypothetical protein
MGTCFSISETWLLDGSKTWFVMMEISLVGGGSRYDRLYSETSGLTTIFGPDQQRVIQARSSRNKDLLGETEMNMVSF